jgi:uncharacterized NAD(P)/FAD-binding protein YdhS
LRSVFKEVRARVKEHPDWRSVMDSLRPQTASLWSGWSALERRRFLRHVRAFWDAHRHRMAPSVAAEVQRLHESEELEIVAGRLLQIAASGGALRVCVKRRGTQENFTREVQAFVNCTGPSGSVWQTQSELLRDLIRQGLARPDPLGIGVDTDEEGVLLDAVGRRRPGLMAVGPLRKGTLWESTAIPELRAQAERVAEQVVWALAGSQRSAAQGWGRV